MTIKKTCSALAASALALTLAACGSSGGTSAASGGGGGGGGKGKVPAKTIGVWSSQGSGEGEQETLAAVKAATKAVGWKTIVVDGNGNPSTMASTMQTLLSDKVDAIVAIYLNTGAVAPQLAQAKKAGIPVISAGFTATPSSNVTAEYAPDEHVESSMLIDRMHKDLPSGGLVAPIMVAGYTGVDQEYDGLKSAAAANKFTLLNREDVPITNLFGLTPKAATSIINGNPSLKAIYMGIDIFTQIIKPAVKQLGKDIPLYGFGAISSALPYIKKGGVTVVTSDNPKSGFIAVDSLLGYFVNKTPIPKTAPSSEAFDYKIVDKTNVPSGSVVYPQSSYDQPFLTKWKSQYGISG